MAKFADQTIITVLNVQRQLLELIDEAKSTEYLILERFGENEETLIALEELQNITERLRNSYSRLYTLLLRIAEAQPFADPDTLELLMRSIEQAQDNIAASTASIQESKGEAGLL